MFNMLIKYKIKNVHTIPPKALISNRDALI